ncbi:MAG: GNAT family N-acetyltransferase [Fidelibacterota bacterium]
MITIRKATLNDREIILFGNLAMARETEGKVLDSQVVRQGVTALLSDARKGVYYLAEINGKIAGQLMITTEWSDWRNREFWWIQSVYIHPEFRRQGIYSALHTEIRSLARRAGNVCGLRLYVDKQNRLAQKTYASQGMVPAHYDLYEEDWALHS